MEKRKLASIQRIWDISPIEGAERIEKISVLGWKCVAKKGEFSRGDLCVYFEVDSFLPVREEFEFLRSGSFRRSDILGEGFHLRTQVFRGQISQGLVLPLSCLPPGEYSLGDNVTEILGVRKWEIEERVSSEGTIIGGLPAFIPKTDELRIQSYPALLDDIRAVPEYYISTKMDGTSVTMYLSGGRFGVCGRNYEYADTESCAMWRYAREHGIEDKLKGSGLSDVAIQGEYCGAGIQKNRLKLRRPEWYVFTVIDTSLHKRYSLDEMASFCKIAGLRMVPVEERGTFFPYRTVDEVIARAKGKYPSGINKEGIVIRPTVPVYSPTIEGYLSFKALNNDYLLRE